MPWLMTPFEGAQEVGGMKDVFNLHLSKGRQVIERAFGMMIKRWRILASSLDYSVDRCNRVIRVCALLHNMCLTATKRVLLSKRLFKKGNRRNAPRGANQCAAYQLSN
jgi:hypothetical protein